MSSRTDKSYLKFVDEVEACSRCANTMDEDYQGYRSPAMVYSPANPINQPKTFATRPDSRSSDNNIDIVRLMYMYEVQQTDIEKLKTKMTQMEVDMKVQNILAAQEMASMRGKCQHSQHKPQVLEDVPPRNGQLDYSQTAWDMLFKENVFLKKKNNALLSEINNLKLMLDAWLDNSPAELSEDCNDRSDHMRSESDAFTEEGKKVNLCDEKLTDSCVPTLAEIDEKQDIAAVVEAVVQDTVANEMCKINELVEDSDTNGFVSPNTTSVGIEVVLSTSSDSSTSDVTIKEAVDCLTSLDKPKNCNEGTVEQLMSSSELEVVHVPKLAETVKTAVDSTKKNNDLIAPDFKSNPVNVLNNLCMSRHWTKPSYAFFESRLNNKPIFLVHCTLLTYTFKAEATSKKQGKRLAAIGMYHMVVEHVTEDEPLAKTLVKYAPENKTKSTGLTFVDAPVHSSAKSHEEQVIIEDVVEAPVTAVDSSEDTGTVIGIDNVSVRKNMSTVVVDDSPSHLTEKHEAVRLETTTEFADSNGNVPSVVVIEDEPLPSFSPEHAEFANRLRLSKNPGVQKLKDIDFINQNKVHCCIELLFQIADEEELALFYNIRCTAATLQQDMTTVELTISPLAEPAIGYGKSEFDAQNDAAYVYLTRFKFMLK